MNADDRTKLALCVAVSIGAHLLLRQLLDELPPRREPPPPVMVAVRVEPRPVREPPPEPEVQQPPPAPPQ
ncbi:MAG TPA: hypothetical protein VHE35_07780, partial [Kofleriaceae bacterium]|nr:hypothetical protein [Kofleriaceae bacterium]